MLVLCLDVGWEALRQKNGSPSLTMDLNWYCTIRGRWHSTQILTVAQGGKA